MGYVGPTSKEKEKTNNKKLKSKAKKGIENGKTKVFFLIFSFLYFFLRFTETCPSEFVGINTESALRDEGYA